MKPFQYWTNIVFSTVKCSLLLSVDLLFFTRGLFLSLKLVYITEFKCCQLTHVLFFDSLWMNLFRHLVSRRIIDAFYLAFMLVTFDSVCLMGITWCLLRDSLCLILTHFL